MFKRMIFGTVLWAAAFAASAEAPSSPPSSAIAIAAYSARPALNLTSPDLLGTGEGLALGQTPVFSGGADAASWARALESDATGPVRIAGPVGAFGPHLNETSVTQHWPSLLSLHRGAFGVDVSPHASLGWNSLGRSAEAGATLRVGNLASVSVRDRRRLDYSSRWFIYASTSGKAVGYAFSDGPDGWKRGGLAVDQGSYVSSQEAGLAWRQGEMGASFGYVKEQFRSQTFKLDDGLVELKFSLFQR